MLEEEPEIRQVIAEALERHYKGHEQYGQWYADKKDWLFEMEQELFDMINYAVYQIIKIRKIRGGEKPRH